MICAETKSFCIEALREFSTRVFVHFGCPQEDAEQEAEQRVSKLLISKYAGKSDPLFPERVLANIAKACQVICLRA